MATRLVWEVELEDLLNEPDKVAKRVTEKGTPIIVKNVGVLVRSIRGDEFLKAIGRVGDQYVFLYTEEQYRPTPTSVRSSLEECSAARVWIDNNMLLHPYLLSFDALEVVKRDNPNWADKYAWDRIPRSWFL